MDVKQLEYFVAVAEDGSFTRAAQKLGIAQPALSRQVRLLEVELRQSLLIRNGRGALPTAAGKLLLDHARGILHQVSRAQEDLGRMRGDLSGRIALGLPPSVAHALTVPLTHAFQKHLPDAQLTIREGFSADMQESLLNGRLDMALLYNAQNNDGLTIEPLLDEELVLVQRRPAGLQEDPPPSPIALKEIAKLPLVIPSRPNAIRMHLESQMALHHCKPTIHLEIDGVSSILDLVADGAGHAILTRNAVAHSIRPSAYRVITITKPTLHIPLLLVKSAKRASSLTLDTTLELVQQTARRILKSHATAN
jgi:LysR family nitrogen assimilation transcriptional regulator